jgi:hypothetical protein
MLADSDFAGESGTRFLYQLRQRWRVLRKQGQPDLVGVGTQARDTADVVYALVAQRYRRPANLFWLDILKLPARPSHVVLVGMNVQRAGHDSGRACGSGAIQERVQFRVRNGRQQWAQ